MQNGVPFNGLASTVAAFPTFTCNWEAVALHPVPGHSHLQTTSVYLHTYEARLKQVAGLASFVPSNGPSSAPSSTSTNSDPRAGGPRHVASRRTSHRSV